jgi:hypothetical protein
MKSFRLPLSFFYLFAFAGFFISFKQIRQHDAIEWKPGIKIGWKDFKAKPDLKSPYYANTNSGIQYELFAQGDTAWLTIKAVFNSYKSWAKLDNKISDTLLRHEQLHFDITELFARKFRSRLAALKVHPNKINETFEKTRLEIDKESDKYQDQYDSETEHAMNYERQSWWDRKITADIRALDKFADTEVKVVLKKKK